MTPRAKTILKWVILSLLIAYVVGMGIWARGEAERNTCRSIVITMGEKGLSDTITVKGVRTELMKYSRTSSKPDPICGCGYYHHAQDPQRTKRRFDPM